MYIVSVQLRLLKHMEIRLHGFKNMLESIKDRVVVHCLFSDRRTIFPEGPEKEKHLDKKKKKERWRLNNIITVFSWSFKHFLKTEAQFLSSLNTRLKTVCRNETLHKTDSFHQNAQVSHEYVQQRNNGGIKLHIHLVLFLHLHCNF